MIKAMRAAATASAAAAVVLAGTACSSAAPGASSDEHRAPAGAPPVRPYLHRFRYITQLASTIPRNGDVNPYGVAVVPVTAGRLTRGDTLVSNFNGKANVQGTGTTIVQVAPDGTMRRFARITSLPRTMRCPGGVGLTTALAILPGGWVVVGSLPTRNGGALPAVNPLGCLIVLNSRGLLAETLTGQQINGPWDMTVRATAGHADLFVANVLSRVAGASGPPSKTGLCTVIRVDLTLRPGSRPAVAGVTVVGTGFPWRLDKAALVQARPASR